jgi:hypothetical protein
MAVYSRDGSPVAAWAYSMISRPIPPRVPVEISATIAPITAAAAASRTDGIRYGTDAGSRSRSNVAHQPQASARNSSTSAGRGEVSPRSMPTAIGKNAR